MKLTPAQRAFLADLVRAGRQDCIESYSPARKLIELGLATSKAGSFGQLHVVPTDAGRAAVHIQQRASE